MDWNEMLQWGHVLSDVEITYGRQGLYPVGPASMGPRPFRRGNEALRELAFEALLGFNGATSFQTWK